MVIQYLLNYQHELMEKKIDLSKSLQKNQLLMKENAGFKSFIEASEDKSYDSFFPQNYKNDINEKRIEELKEREVELEENNKQLESQIKSIEDKISELDNIIKTVKQDNRKSKNMEKELDDNEVFHLKLLENQEYEKERIAREFQNSTIQSLTSMMNKIELCTKLMNIDSNRCKLELKSLSKTVKETIHNIKEVAYDICPIPMNETYDESSILMDEINDECPMSMDDLNNECPVSDDISIGKILERELKRFRKNNNIKISYKTVGGSDGVSSVIGLTMLRIIREAYSNTVKHANAKHINIYIEYKKNNIQIKIEDDGCGFDVSEVRSITDKHKSGYGLSIMYEKVYLLSGEIDIESEKDKGTKIYISIPKIK